VFGGRCNVAKIFIDNGHKKHYLIIRYEKEEKCRMK